MPPALLPFVLQGSPLTQPLTPPSRWITGIFETTIPLTLTLPKAKVKAKVKAKAKRDKVKDKAKEKANPKVMKIVPPPLPLPYMPQQPKEKARNNSTTHPPPIPFAVARLVIVAGPAFFLSIISPLSDHPHGPACHCGRSRLATHILNSLPSHLSAQPSDIPTFKARLVIVAGPASNLFPHSFLSITPIFLHLLLPFPQAHDRACYYCKSHPSTCSPPHPPSSYLFPPYLSFGPACHCGRSRQIPLLTRPVALPFWIPIFNTLSLLCLYLGPACHCGRSRLLHPHCLPPHLLLSLPSVTPP